METATLITVVLVIALALAAGCGQAREPGVVLWHAYTGMERTALEHTAAQWNAKGPVARIENSPRFLIKPTVKLGTNDQITGFLQLDSYTVDGRGQAATVAPIATAMRRPSPEATTFPANSPLTAARKPKREDRPGRTPTRPGQRALRIL